MAAGSWVFTTNARNKLLTGGFDLDSDTFKCALFLSTSDLSTSSTTYAGVTNEHANGSGATQRTIIDSVLTGAQSSPWVSPALQMAHGWEVSVTRLAGSDRTIGWSLRKVS